MANHAKNISEVMRYQCELTKKWLNNSDTADSNSVPLSSIGGACGRALHGYVLCVVLHKTFHLRQEFYRTRIIGW